jgi:hypothetical protein
MIVLLAVVGYCLYRADSVLKAPWNSVYVFGLPRVNRV